MKNLIIHNPTYKSPYDAYTLTVYKVDGSIDRIFLRRIGTHQILANSSSIAAIRRFAEKNKLNVDTELW